MFRLNIAFSTGILCTFHDSDYFVSRFNVPSESTDIIGNTLRSR